MFSNQLNNHKNAWITILIDLLKVDGSFDGEGLGLYYFDLDLSDIAENLSDEDIEQELSKYHLNKQELLDVYKRQSQCCVMDRFVIILRKWIKR